jgi:hypothetical protein
MAFLLLNCACNLMIGVSMLSLIVIYAVIALFCFPVVLYLIHNAPTGFENENGFHSEKTEPDTHAIHFYGAHKSA